MAPLLCSAVCGFDAPDVVLAHSQHGRRTVVTGGTGPAAPGTPREALRYEIGSASKTLTGLLLADLSLRGELELDDRALDHLPAPHAHRHSHLHRHPHPDARPHPHLSAVTLLHLVTHTAGLPRLPWDFYPQALPHWRTNPYAGYSRERLLAAFARSRPRHPPGRRWHYSNFGAALLGPALSGAAGSPYERLLSRHIFEPLGLWETGTVPLGAGKDATGHAGDGVTALPPFDAGGFFASGAVRATPGDLLSYLEAHLSPGDAPPGLRAALREVQKPVLRRGLGYRHTHTLSWFRHPTDEGPLYFHSGATMGQETFLGFRPATGTALVALATRRYTRSRALGPTAYRLLTGRSPGA
ncbi:beta-lactamase family protein [Streptomyces sp. N2-109]|uniref:Beta-lactamase family protein n=1 Tax=Streptomyces gossypii TaxID=2883101 RepID=A0ABT2JPD3_9ACTN|nr:serine hydrolase domain-containing protein [Streptomyces gossypii]MCT2589738.1 beta-lactamase family protein [Streptomyces gossypii]